MSDSSVDRYRLRIESVSGIRVVNVCNSSRSCANFGVVVYFEKYHALGNDYLVASKQIAPQLSGERIRLICHRHFGIGSDGILVDTGTNDDCEHSLRIFNPDGSEAEKSGNGLRIFARYLFDQKRVGNTPFTIDTAGGIVTATIVDAGRRIRIAMGRVSFNSAKIPVRGPEREVIREKIELHQGEASQTFLVCAATVGNPHCVVLCDAPPEGPVARFWGPVIENLPMFPRRANVQFLHVRDRESIQIEIWERGAGYTLASGTSSTAAAAVARRLNLCDDSIQVIMPGGQLQIDFNNQNEATMTGPVTYIGSAQITKEALEVMQE